MIVTESESKVICVDNVYMHADAEEHFFRTFGMLEKIYGCTYLAFMLEDLENKRRVNFISNKSWHNIFINEHYIDFCPLVEIGRNVDSIILNWNSVANNTKSAREVVGVRGEHNIANGISFSGIIDYCGVKVKEMIGLGADIKHHDFAKLIINNIHHVQAMLESLRARTIYQILREKIL